MKLEFLRNGGEEWLDHGGPAQDPRVLCHLWLYVLWLHSHVAEPWVKDTGHLFVSLVTTRTYLKQKFTKNREDSSFVATGLQGIRRAVGSPKQAHGTPERVCPLGPYSQVEFLSTNGHIQRTPCRRAVFDA